MSFKELVEQHDERQGFGRNEISASSNKQPWMGKLVNNVQFRWGRNNNSTNCFIQ